MNKNLLNLLKKILINDSNNEVKLFFKYKQNSFTSKMKFSLIIQFNNFMKEFGKEFFWDISI